MSGNQEKKTEITEAKRYFLVEQALKNRYSYTEFLEQQEIERNFYKETEINREAYYQDVERVLHTPRYVICHNFEDIYAFLPILEREGYPIPEDTIPHERGHWNQLLEEGLTPIIGFYFVSLDGINYRKALQIFTSPIQIPEEMTDLEFFGAMKRVLSAVDTLSSSDRIMLGEDDSNSS